MSLKKIFHLSDLHLGYGESDEQLHGLVARLLAAAHGRPKDFVVVITGDLVHDAREENYRAARDFLAALRDAGFDVLAAPGNHDYRSGGGRAWRRPDAANVGRFRRVLFGEEPDYPTLDILPAAGGPGAIAFIGLDTMREVFRRRDAVYDRGEFGAGQLARLREMLSREDVRDCGRRVIYFHHHPASDFPLPRPGGARAFQALLFEVIAGGISIDALLFGHTHFGRARHGFGGVPRCYNAGTATVKPRPRAIDWLPAFKPRAATRCISLDLPLEADFVIGQT